MGVLDRVADGLRNLAGSGPGSGAPPRLSREQAARLPAGGLGSLARGLRVARPGAWAGGDAGAACVAQRWTGPGVWAGGGAAGHGLAAAAPACTAVLRILVGVVW